VLQYSVLNSPYICIPLFYTDGKFESFANVEKKLSHFRFEFFGMMQRDIKNVQGLYRRHINVAFDRMMKLVNSFARVEISSSLV
jgi:hypothetical protein